MGERPEIPTDEASRQHVARSWDPVYGDRRQEIVFIGADMDEAALRRQLDACLVGEANAEIIALTAWKNLPDPFPVWKRRSVA